MVSKVIKSDVLCVYTESQKPATSTLNNAKAKNRPAASLSECNLTTFRAAQITLQNTLYSLLRPLFDVKENLFFYPPHGRLQLNPDQR